MAEVPWLGNLMQWLFSVPCPQEALGLSAVLELWGHPAVNEIQIRDFFPVSVEVGLAPSLCKQAGQGLTRGLLGVRHLQFFQGEVLPLFQGC